MEMKRERFMDDEELSIERERETKRGRFIMNDDDDDDDDLKVLLPPEIITEILSRLSADSAIGSRGICKQWLSLIDHPSFIESHTSQVISSSTSIPKKVGNYLIPNSSSSSSGFLLFAQQEISSFHIQFVEYNDYYVNDEEEEEEEEEEDGKLLLGVPEFKPSKPITGHPFFPFYCDYSDYWGTLLISSCNGLVCMASTKPNYFNDAFVCNPFTREYVNLRTTATTTTDDDNDDVRRDNNEEEEEEERRQERKGGRMSYGFGYLPSTDEYKVVSIYYPELKGGKGKVSVYTIGSDSRWRNKGETPYWVYTDLHPGLFANGALHWFTNTKTKKIVSFDLAAEEFRVVVPLPPPPPSTNHVDKLGVLGGCLCVTRSDKTRCESPKDIWVLNLNTEENKFLWKKRFSIPWKGSTCRGAPQVVLKSGKILLRSGLGLISYDSKTEAFNEDGLISCNSKEAFGEDEEESIFYDPNRLKVIPYVKSFVSLKTLGEKDVKYFGGTKLSRHLEKTMLNTSGGHQPQLQLQQQG